ncbi:transglycosylase SLT domain protein [Leptospira ryugenii]|uniref:Transglycosylase SLT domain protein n=1 Tax=Leptospira ryugenii TaxID=1917863 RepID=A0A2P2E4U8_9LEPT|nr:transglycosylase SLT domain protein [Leptospira ryugenii]
MIEKNLKPDVPKENREATVSPTQVLPAQAPKSETNLSSIIHEKAEEKGLDPNLVKAIIQTESGFQPKAVSPKGALGLMQLMPKTAEMLGVDDPLDPSANIEGGTTYFRDMLQKFGDIDKALAAYNAGPGAVKKYGGVPPYSETQTYIEKVKSNYKKFSREL